MCGECGVVFEQSGLNFIKGIAEEFIRDAVDGAFEIAKARGVDKIEACDLAFYLSITLFFFHKNEHILIIFVFSF